MYAERVLTALPVYNEAKHVQGVLAEVRKYSDEVLVVDDGSTDGTSELLDAEPGIAVVHHGHNSGYGAALRTAIRYAIDRQYDVLVTIDCDGQHEPRRIPRFVSAASGWDLVSGSRYLKQYAGDSAPPVDRRRINVLLTAELNRRLKLSLTDAFCGFKAYRVAALSRLRLTEDGYAMPLELWVQAACTRWRIRELPVPLVYLDLARSFGGALDDAETRLAHYRDVLERAIAAARMTAPVGSLCRELAG
jgi:dolichol-phosphate mannosyltransferase